MFFLTKKDVILILIYINLATPIQHSMYKRYVRKDSILRTTEVSSISSCYFECWDVEFKCCAVGFLPSQINTREQKKNVTCHMIECHQQLDGYDVLELEVFETPKLENTIPEKLLKNGIANQTNLWSNGYAQNAVDGEYHQYFFSHCAVLGDGGGTWEYVLPYNSVIESIELYFNNRSMSNHANVSIMNLDSGFSYCGKIGNVTNTYMERIYCEKSLVGKGIRFQTKLSYQTICEIDIYGKVLLGNLK